ncbi:hypothetical protein EJ03DRAFT_377860 [Teratosphaeria nubilosa]|uniref:VWFA domain-containing protein n=1 Tax=Teratosphaeria nubilosa TaxID=161662 RepID=A0A6G1KXJ3_9PEZI|nr:hypothetical protein EJ03DRAFT_377860 [Teratosphaeria nubilosa]
MALEQWALPKLHDLLPLDDAELRQVIQHTNSLPDDQASANLGGLLGDSPEAIEFISNFMERRVAGGSAKVDILIKTDSHDEKTYPPMSDSKGAVTNDGNIGTSTSVHQNGTSSSKDVPQYAPPAGQPPGYNESMKPKRHQVPAHHHTNAVIEAGKVRARDEQEMQQLLQNLQYQYRIFNSDIEPEHDTDYYCMCPIHQYQARKMSRYGVQEQWSRAVMYPGEKYYDDNKFRPALFNSNPYRYGTVSPYGYMQGTWGMQRPQPGYHAQNVRQTIALNNELNKKAQAKIDAQEPQHSIWHDDPVEAAMASMNLNGKRKSIIAPASEKESSDSKYPAEKRASLAFSSDALSEASKPSKLSVFSSFKSNLGFKTPEEKAVKKATKSATAGASLRSAIQAEERGRWPDNEWRQLVADYQEKVGMTKKIADLRARAPTQYLHLLRAGYFEPIPVAWANQASNPLKFSIEAAAGWRGITPAWRGYEDTAEERLYWVLNHREGSVGMRMKPDFISEMNMARERMNRAVEPPPLYYAADDTCHLQHTSQGYSKQVPPAPFRAYDRPENPTDDTMILLDTSGSMDFDPFRPIYNQYLITGYANSTQPKNKDVAKSIIRRFVDAMANHDHSGAGYDLCTFANSSRYIGTVNHKNLDKMWRGISMGGGTRVMTGWQKVKDLHFQKHSVSATHHPIYGWQAGPQTPILRLLLLLDGEATDMDEFELDLLSCSWAHVTIFLIGVDGCPHHHRHANELQRISDVNHHVSFVDAQGNCPERFVTHELLKRHLGYDVSMREFEEMEMPPAYDG